MTKEDKRQEIASALAALKKQIESLRKSIADLRQKIGAKPTKRDRSKPPDGSRSPES